MTSSQARPAGQQAPLTALSGQRGSQCETRKVEPPNRKKHIKEKNLPWSVFDRLPQVYLTRIALRELDLRNSLQPTLAVYPNPPPSSDLLRFARHGGPDLRFIRGYSDATAMVTPSSTGDDMSPLPRQRNKRVSPADSHFESVLANHNIFLQLHEFPDGTTSPTPKNLAQVLEYLFRPRNCPSLSGVSQSDLVIFTQETLAAAEGSIMMEAVNTLVGPGKISRSCSSVTFHNLESMTGGVTTQPNPDLFDGARLGDVDAGICEELDATIIPSKNARVPVVPNFFLEAKTFTGIPAVAWKQACWDGAHGARAIHALQNFGRGPGEEQEVFDGNAYTYSATFCGGVLEVFAHFVRLASDGRREYHMTMLAGINMKSSIARFIEGASVLRNARDLAKLHRDTFIKAANERAVERRKRDGSKAEEGI